MFMADDIGVSASGVGTVVQVQKGVLPTSFVPSGTAEQVAQSVVEQISKATPSTKEVASFNLVGKSAIVGASLGAGVESVQAAPTQMMRLQNVPTPAQSIAEPQTQIDRTYPASIPTSLPASSVQSISIQSPITSRSQASIQDVSPAQPQSPAQLPSQIPIPAQPQSPAQLPATSQIPAQPQAPQQVQVPGQVPAPFPTPPPFFGGVPTGAIPIIPFGTRIRGVSDVSSAINISSASPLSAYTPSIAGILSGAKTKRIPDLAKITAFDVRLPKVSI